MVVVSLLIVEMVASYRAYYQVRSLKLNAPEPGLHDGSIINTIVVSFARTPVDLRIESIQGSHAETLALQVIPDNTWPFFDPRPRQATQSVVLTHSSWPPSSQDLPGCAPLQRDVSSGPDCRRHWSASSQWRFSISEGGSIMRHLVIAMRFTSTSVLFVLLATATFAQSGRSWMHGFVFDESPTRGLANATVELIGKQDDERLRSVKLSTQSDKEGNYSLKDIPYGDYTFRVSAAGFVSYQVEIYVAPDMLTELHVKLRRKA